MKCNNCGMELEEGVTLCPECGFENGEQNPEPQVTQESAEVDVPVTEPAEEPEKSLDTAESPSDEKTTPGMTPGKIALLVVLVVAAIAVIAALVASSLKSGSQESETEPSQTVETQESTETTAASTEATIPPDGNPEDVTCKGSYYVSDEAAEAAKDTVVATLGDRELTNGDLQVYYWMQFYGFVNNYSYYGYYGMDLEQSLDTQLSIDGARTWQQYFLSNALSFWNTYEALLLDGENAGFQLDQEYADYLASLPEMLESSAAEAGFASADEMLKADMGAGASLKSYVNYNSLYYNGYYYFTSLMDQLAFTDDEIEAFFDENAEAYAENGLEKTDEVGVAVRHILVEPEGGTMDDSGNVTYSEEEWAECKAAAEAIREEWLAGEATEESFARLAGQYSADTGSNNNGGLYEQVQLGQMVEPFEDWCFDAARVYGDCELVQTSYGYHVMFFVERAPLWFSTARADLKTERSAQMLEEIMAKYEFTVDYSAIVLGEADLQG